MGKLTGNSNKIKVLVVDNEELFASTLASRLRGDCLEVEYACSGKEAFKAVKVFHPDVIVLDLWMEGMDGLEVLKQLKNSDLDIAVILLTGYGSFNTGLACMQLGAYDYMIKPVDLNQLVETIIAASCQPFLRRGEDLSF